MKKLSIEEKAQRYDNAIEIAKSLYDYNQPISASNVIINNIFPELIESEDERIRKKLIRAFKSLNTIKVWNGIERTDILAWLEKQYADPIKEYWRGYNEGKQNILDKYAELEKQAKQPKQEWSEEDETMATNIIIMLKEGASLHFNKNDIVKGVDWLKSLRPQNNITDEELAQAKKDAYNDALDKIEYHSGEPTFDDGWSAAIDYIRNKSLRPQSTWKPSEGQLECLGYAIEKAEKDWSPLINNRIYLTLKALKEQLEKL